MKIKGISVLILMIGLSACANETEVSIATKIAQNPQERLSLLSSECRDVYGSSHVVTPSNFKNGKIGYKPHKKEMLELCDIMHRNAKGGNVGTSSEQLFNRCMDEKVVGDKIFSHKNKKHIHRKEEMCKAFRSVM